MGVFASLFPHCLWGAVAAYFIHTVLRRANSRFQIARLEASRLNDAAAIGALQEALKELPVRLEKVETRLSKVEQPPPSRKVQF